MLHKEIWGLTFLAYILWIFLGTPLDRIPRTCAPIGWVGNVTVSVSALIVPSYQKPTQNLFDKITYGCEYTVWRLFYQGDYNKWLESQGKQPVSGPAAGQPATGLPPVGLPKEAASGQVGKGKDGLSEDGAKPAEKDAKPAEKDAKPTGGEEAR